VAKGRDHVAVYLNQRRAAKAAFGTWDKPGPHGKAVQKLDGPMARELIRYWVAEAGRVKAEAASKPERVREDLASAVERYTSAVRPVADNPPKGLMDFTTTVKFWAETGRLAQTFASIGVVPDRSDLWLEAVAEAATDVAKGAARVVRGGMNWGLIALGLLAVLALSRR
jgi:hypothetical protein